MNHITITVPPDHVTVLCQFLSHAAKKKREHAERTDSLKGANAARFEAMVFDAVVDQMIAK